MHVTHRRTAVIAVAAAAVAGAGFTGGAAAASPHSSHVARVAHSGTVTTVGVTATVKRISMSRHTIPAGPIEFDVSTNDSRSHTVQLARLRNGYTLQQAHHDINKAFKGDVDAIRRVDTKIVFRGGVQVKPGKPAAFDVNLPAGDWLMLDQQGQGLAKFTVKGKSSNAALPATQGSITAFTYGFGWSGPIRRSALIRFSNHADQPHLLVMQHVADSTTYKQVRQEFKKPRRGRPSWALGGSTQAGVLSPGTSEDMTIYLPAGKYLILCFWPDRDTGMPHAFMGMYKLITISS